MSGFADPILAVLLPVILVATGGLVCLASEPFLQPERKHRVLPWIGSIFLLLAAVAAWFGRPEELISIGGLYGNDPIRALLQLAVIAAALAGMAGLQQSLGRDRFAGGEPYALTLLSATGAMLMVSASQYMGLFIGLELASIAIYALVGTRRHRAESGEGLLKYLVMGAVFSAIFLYGVALSYGATGSLAYGADALEGRDRLLVLGQTCLVIGLLFKVGAVPFHFWSPDAYTGAPIAVTGFMAAAMKVGGFTALAGIWIGLLQADGGVVALHRPVALEQGSVHLTDSLQKVLFGVAVLSLLVGNFSALGQSHLRRLMAFSSVAHAGYLLLAFSLPAGVAPGATLSLHGLWYYLIAYAIAGSAALALLAAFADHDDEDRLDDLAGRARRDPLVGIAITVLVASLAGLPPTAGFIGKYLILGDLVAKGMIAIAILAMLLAVVGAVYYLRFLVELWAGEREGETPRVVGGLTYAVGAAATVLTVALVAWPLLGQEAADDGPSVAQQQQATTAR